MGMVTTTTAMDMDTRAATTKQAATVNTTVTTTREMDATRATTEQAPVNAISMGITTTLTTEQAPVNAMGMGMGTATKTTTVEQAAQEAAEVAHQ